jgi:CDP-glucose 4,6-dehydratase
MDKSYFSALNSLAGPILITGHTGFKGAWLTYLLKEMNFDVVGLSLPAEPSSLYLRSQMGGLIPEIFGDIRNKDFVHQAITKFAPSAIIHLAAQPLVIKSYELPAETFEINVQGTANVLDSAFNSRSVKVIAVVTTDKVYKNTNMGHKFKETDALEGKDPYSASKVGTEAVVAAWQQIASVKSGPHVISLRAGNVIGGGDFAENRLFPDIVRAKASNQELVVRNPESSRPWQHALDPLLGYVMAIEAVLKGQKFKYLNFGPKESSLQVLDVLDIVNSHWEMKYRFLKESVVTEAQLLDLDSSLANSLLGWQPTFTQEKAIIETIRWWNQILTEKMPASDACKIGVKNFLSSSAS